MKRNKAYHYWLGGNKTFIFLALILMPTIFINPISVFIIVPIIFNAVTDNFFMVNGMKERQDESLRFIMTLPFSRKDIFNAYLKGILMLSGLFIIEATLLKLFAYLFGFSSVFFQSFGTKNAKDILFFVFVFTITVLVSAIFQIYIINDYTTNGKALVNCIYLFAVLPFVFILCYFKSIIIGIINGGSVDNGKGEIIELNKMIDVSKVERFLSDVMIWIYIIILAVLFVMLIKTTKYASKKFIGGE